MKPLICARKIQYSNRHMALVNADGAGRMPTCGFSRLTRFHYFYQNMKYMNNDSVITSEKQYLGYTSYRPNTFACMVSVAFVYI